MNELFARRMEALKASDIRELLKLTEAGGVISLAGGLPAPELFPCAELAAIAERVLREEGARALQYSPTEGHAALRERIAERLGRIWGAAVPPERVLITTGSQQGLDLVGKLLLDEADEVLCESPTYLGAISAWNVFRPRWIEVPTDEDGMDIAALEERLAACRRPKLVYVVPNFQNPSGRTWTHQRRHHLMEVIARHDVALVEDNPYGELRYEGTHLPSLMSLDARGRVIGLGTLSKTLSPGLRLGWAVAAGPVFEKLVILKQGADLHTSTLNQMMAAEFVGSDAFAAHVARIIEVYRDRRDAMLRALEREMPAAVRFTRPAGGLFLWVELPPGMDARLLLRRCLSHGVAFVPGAAFHPCGGGDNTLRLNFSNMPPARIEEGIRRLAAAVRELAAAGTAAAA